MRRLAFRRSGFYSGAVSASPHLAVLIGARAEALRQLLPQVRPELRCRVLTDIYALADDASIEDADSVWIDEATLDERARGALVFAQRLRPEQTRVLLVDARINGSASAKAHDSDGEDFGAQIVAAPPEIPVLRRILGVEEAEDDGDEVVFAGIADQLANPLAALAARLQLCEMALQTRASVDFEDNLALARETTERMNKNLEKLRMMTARGPGTQRAHGIYAALRRVLSSGALREESVDAVDIPSSDEAELDVWVDAGFFEQALAGVLRTSLDLSADGVAARAHARGDHVLLELRLEAPREIPRECTDLFAPFALGSVLRDPDLGLDLSLTRALLRSGGGRIREVLHSGYLEAFALEIPRAIHASQTDDGQD